MAALFHAGRDGAACRIEALLSVCLSLWALCFFFSFFKRKRFDKIQVAQSWLTRGKGMSTKLPRKKLEAFCLLDVKCM